MKRPARALSLRELVADLGTGGIALVGYLDEGAREGPPAFRTLIQLDGDISLQIAKSALGDPRFDAAFAAHREQVEVLLGRRVARLRGWTQMGGLALGLALGLGSFVTALSQLEALDQAHEWLLLLVGPALAAALGALTKRWLIPALLRALIRKVALERVREPREQARHDEAMTLAAQTRRAARLAARAL